MNYTSNYKLNLPEGRDVVDIAKLNENFTKLDSTVKNVDSRVTTVSNQLTSSSEDLEEIINSVDTSRKPVIGTYIGDEKPSRSIELGFRPSLVILAHRWGFVDNRSAMASSSWSAGNSYGTLLSIHSTGFTVYYEAYHCHTNQNSDSFLYAAWR